MIRVCTDDVSSSTACSFGSSVVLEAKGLIGPAYPKVSSNPNFMSHEIKTASGEIFPPVRAEMGADGGLRTVGFYAAFGNVSGRAENARLWHCKFKARFF